MSTGEAGASAGTVYLVAGVLGTLSVNASATLRDLDVRKLVKKGYS